MFVGISANAQVFNQTFVDRCTGEVKVVTANFATGSATVAFYDKIKTFTYQQYLNGELQAWLIQTYNWWQALSPCSSTTTQVQQAQQTAQAAQQAAQTAQTAASSASSAASSAATAATNTMGGTTNASSNTTNGSTSQNSSTNNTNQSSNSNSSGSTESSSGGSSGGSSEGKSEGGGGTSEEGKSSETKSEETETKSGESKESSEETKSEESKSDEGGDEETNSDDDGNGEESEEVKEEKKKEESKKEEKKRKTQMLPIQLRADAMAMQNPLGGYNAAINFGASRSSIFGDVSYSANLMVFDNLKQQTLALGRTKVIMDESYNVDWIESMGLSYGNNFGTQSTSANVMRLKPMGKKGTIGIGVNYTYMFGGMLEKPMGSMGYNLLYTNILTGPESRLTYAPALIISQTPISFTLNDTPNIPNYKEQNDILLPSTVSNDAMFILANSFTYRLTKRFTFNFGYTVIKSTNPLIPLINSFMIGAKLPF